MQQNSKRQPGGALWQGILASRQTRMALSDSLAEVPLEPRQAPLPVLQNHYQLQYHGTHAAFFAVARRDTALQPDLLSPENLRELAYSLQIYEQGRSLLTQAIVTRPRFVSPRTRRRANSPRGRLALLPASQMPTGKRRARSLDLSEDERGRHGLLARALSAAFGS